MLFQKVRTRPDLTQGDVQWGRGETFEHAMLGKLYLHPTTANFGILDNIAIGIWYDTISDKRHDIGRKQPRDWSDCAHG